MRGGSRQHVHCDVQTRVGAAFAAIYPSERETVSPLLLRVFVRARAARGARTRRRLGVGFLGLLPTDRLLTDRRMRTCMETAISLVQ
jgi:hypothetical protein